MKLITEISADNEMTTPGEWTANHSVSLSVILVI